ncbi:DUF3558 domain-containing protein [Nocardia stercoris]|uniref:DUF3558 domain-containing protein n=1 Tax=Nocardia stercoris TaxID=2483361 RepID=A0A3M2L252_9NOCA|nr:DUF3558 domain-containing protein [Nocardia stercoris]RMI29895.1 DUF3558 domain-containing protein [Nocardia stercoris]
MKQICAYALVGATLLLAGCEVSVSSAGGTSAPTLPAVPNNMVSVSPAPSGHGAIGLDPCTSLPDAAVTKAGFDPATRRRSDSVFGTYSFIGCSFDHKISSDIGVTVTDRSLDVAVAGLSIDDFRRREGARAKDVTINGHNGIEYLHASAEECYVTLPMSSGGVLDIGQTVMSVYSHDRPCDNIEAVASEIQASLAVK